MKSKFCSRLLTKDRLAGARFHGTWVWIKWRFQIFIISYCGPSSSRKLAVVSARKTAVVNQWWLSWTWTMVLWPALTWRLTQSNLCIHGWMVKFCTFKALRRAIWRWRMSLIWLKINYGTLMTMVRFMVWWGSPLRWMGLFMRIKSSRHRSRD